MKFNSNILLCSTVVIGLVACSGSDEPNSNEAQITSTAQESLTTENTGDSEGLPVQKILPVSASAAENELGIKADNFDQQIIIKPAGLSLFEDEHEAEENEDIMDDDAEDATENHDNKKEAQRRKDIENEEKRNQSRESRIESMETCSDYLGTDLNNIKISENGQTTELPSTDYLAVEASGNNNSLNLLITKDEAVEGQAEMAGICFLLTGNSSGINIVLDQVKVSKVIFIVFGNASTVTIEVKSGSELVDLGLNIVGNATEITMLGDGIYPDMELPTRSESDKSEEETEEEKEVKEEETEDDEEEDDDQDKSKGKGKANGGKNKDLEADL